ncbi:NACHT domain-containing protein [Leptolyngbya sp. CCNP1308]|uniref:WD40 domain-containing protein n=1 Tax=Leptolyngbya sp. CCNP1308 TaxID=3110255 RepID=UPI002B1F7F1D|nr:NACHT domain-containing protein [Leptolyngbya sp. CCNP1308]MEA5449410.1 NACHT domain-containing protein [Leptolyngbya sp. CCNP1308]
MDFEEIAVHINQVAVERKGRPLKDVERLVLKGSWENKTYSAMATPAAGYTEDYLKKDVGPKLWQLLTELVDVDLQGVRVTKRNIQNVLQTWIVQGLVAAEPTPPPEIGVEPRFRDGSLRESPLPAPALTVRESPRLDLADCAGRQAELATLTEWIVAERCRTVVLWGLPGVGKTTLAAAIAAAVAPQVHQCGYLALTAGATEQDVLGAIAHWLDPQAAIAPLAQVEWIVDRLNQRRALLILDGLDQFFAPQQLAGSYQANTNALQHFFHRGAEHHHQSCLVWLSREKPADFSQLQGPRVRDYALGDLAADDARPLLQAPAAVSPPVDDWAALAALIDRYGSHPLVLRGLGATLQEVYQGQPWALLQTPQRIVPVGVHRTFTQALDRLSPEEWALLYWLALAQEPVSLDDLTGAMQPALTNVVVQSVLGRGWAQAQATEGRGLVLSLGPVVQILALERLQGVLMAELEAEAFDWLQRLPLVTMTAREVVQERQREAMLVPLAAALKQTYATDAALVAKGDRLLKAIKPLRGQPGYGAGNLIHLCQHLGLGISGVDFSHLAIWQGDLRRVIVQGANFSQAQFSDTTFATALGRDPVAAFSPVGGLSSEENGRHLATGDHEGRLLLWDLKRGKLVWMFNEGQSIRSLAFSPHGDLLAVGTESGQIWLWPVGATYQTDVLDDHQAPVRALAFSPDGSQLASGDDSGRLCLWEVASGFGQGCLEGHAGAIHSLAYSNSGDRLVSGGDDQRACLWNVSDRTLLKDLQARSTAAIRTAGFLPDPNDPDCQPIPFAAGYDDNCLTIWNLATGLPCWILPAEMQALPALALSPNGRYLVCSGQDFTVTMWNIPNRSLCYALPSLEAPVWTLAFSADSRYFVTGSNYTIKLWSAKRGQCWRSFLSQAHPVRCLAFSAGPDSGTILTGHDDTHLRLWQVNAHSPYATGPRALAGHSGSVRTVALSADGQWLASSADDQTLRLWSIATGQSQWVGVTPTAATLLRFSADGQCLATAGPDSGILVWDCATGSAVGELEDAPDSPSALLFSPNGDWLVVGARDGTIGLWPWKQRTRVGPEGAIFDYRVLAGHQSQVHSLSAQGEQLVSASHDGTVRWWSLGQDNGCLGQWQHPGEQWLQGVTQGPGGDVLAITSQNAQVEVWEVETNQRRHTLKGHSQDIWQVLGCPSGTHLVTASQDDEIRVWDLATGLCQQTLRPDRPYEGVNIRGATGLSDTEERMLKSLGAIVSY